MARLVPLANAPRPKKFGLLKGKIEIPEDFDALDPEVLALFAGKRMDREVSAQIG